MKDYTSIRKAYGETENYFIAVMNDTLLQENQAAYSERDQWSQINAAAYFVLCWGQFESFINNKALEIDDHANDIGFMARVQLNIAPTHEYFNDIDKYYFLRCKLAHGETSNIPRLLLSTILDRIEDIAEDLENNAPILRDVFFDF